MRTTALALATLALLAPNAGCMYILCGPTDYYVGSVTASLRLPNATWDADAAEAGIRAAGFDVASRTDTSVASRADGNVTMYASEDRNATRVALSYRLDARALPHAEALEAGRAAIDLHEADALARLAAYAAETNATLEPDDVTWTPDMLHGDC